MLFISLGFINFKWSNVDEGSNKISDPEYEMYKWNIQIYIYIYE
jgi:hypothetical protein